LAKNSMTYFIDGPRGPEAMSKEVQPIRGSKRTERSGRDETKNEITEESNEENDGC